jgi:transposase
MIFVSVTKSSDIASLSKDELVVEVLHLRERISVLEKLAFGPKRERYVPSEIPKAQLALDIEVEAVAEVEVKEVTISEHKRVEVKKKAKQHPGRNPLPANLRREVITLEPSEDVTDCIRIGEEVTEVLEVSPSEFYVKQYVRPKYARKNQEGVAIAALPNRVINKGMAGASVLAMLIIAKFIDHLPIHRQIAIFKRIGVELNYNTVLEWGNESLKVLTPLYDLLKRKVLASNYIQADETGMKVLDKEKKGHSHQGYLWAYRSVLENLVLFEYQPGRGKAGPAEMLKKFIGFLQTDGYGGYDQFKARAYITIMHCMAHARRYFTEAMMNDKARAEFALGLIQKLYAIEREIKGLAIEERYKARQERSVPILGEINSWMIEQYKQVTPKSAIGKALEYSMKRWKELSLYVSDGRLEIDNNPVENAIRPIALGRKNYLFAGSHESAQRIAMIYSLLGTCKAHGVDPLQWLTFVLKEIPNRNVNNLEDLLPQNFKPAM